MKIQIISAVLISLVSAFTFISLATAQQAKVANCHCGADEVCVGGECLPVSAVAPKDASDIDMKSCSVFGDAVTCDLKTNRITMPKKAFEDLTPNR